MGVNPVINAYSRTNGRALKIIAGIYQVAIISILMAL
jgi:hypothetical protein